MRALWSGRQICSHNVSQKVKLIRHLSELLKFWGRQNPPSNVAPGISLISVRKVARKFVQNSFRQTPRKGECPLHISASLVKVTVYSTMRFPENSFIVVTEYSWNYFIPAELS